MSLSWTQVPGNTGKSLLLRLGHSNRISSDPVSHRISLTQTNPACGTDGVYGSEVNLTWFQSQNPSVET